MKGAADMPDCIAYAAIAQAVYLARLDIELENTKEENENDDK